LGVTVGATHAKDSEEIREMLPNTLFLVLGYGAQGATARDAVRGFRRGPAGLEGGIVSSSRPILFPYEFCDAKRWELGVRGALAKAAAELGVAIG
jgi:orotidine-5'-phosphate decarboxylase